MNRLEAVRKLIEQSEENSFAASGGFIKFLPERPLITKPKVWKEETVNYILLLKLMLETLFSEKGEGAVAEYPYSAKAKLVEENNEGSVLITFYNNNNKSYVTIGISPFKVIPLLDALSVMKNTIPFYQLTFKTAKGKPFKLVWKAGKLMFSYFGEYIELPLGDRFLLKASVNKLLNSNEVRPFLGSTCGTRNDEQTGKSYIFFGTKEFREEIEVNKENVFDLLAVLY